MNFFDAVANTPMLQYALMAGAMAGVCCACLSPLVVLKRMAFIGDGMAHATFGGLGVALFFLSGARFDSLSVQAATLVFALGLGVLMGWVTRRKKSAEGLGEDSVIGIAFSASMALGALLIALKQQRAPQYVPAMDSFLFGNLLAIGPLDVALLSSVLLLVLALLVLLNKELVFYAFDPLMAEISGARAVPVHYIFMILLVLTVAASARVVGIVLVSASLVIPGVIALKLCRRLTPALIVSAVIGALSFEAGLFASYELSVPPGSAIVMIQFALLLAVPLIRLVLGLDAREKAAAFQATGSKDGVPPLAHTSHEGAHDHAHHAEDHHRDHDAGKQVNQ